MLQILTIDNCFITKILHIFMVNIYDTPDSLTVYQL